MKRAGLFAAALAFATLLSSTASRATGDGSRSAGAAPPAVVPVVLREPAAAPAAPATPVTTAPVAFAERWRGAGFSGVYLTPKDGFVADDGGVDLAFHFNAALVAEPEWRQSNANSVVVSVAYGVGSGTYAEPFSNPQLFGYMVRSVLGEIEKSLPRDAKKKLHARRVTWSAGFGAVGKILAFAEYYEKIDSVVLLDGIHAGYTGPGPHGAGEGADKVDLKMIGNLVRFAKDAADGKKTMVITHTSIVPPDYASAAETTTALLGAIGLSRQVVNEPTEGMLLTSRVDEKGLHVRGFGGNSKGAHMKHLHLVGWAMRDFVVPERAAALASLRRARPGAVVAEAAPAR